MFSDNNKRTSKKEREAGHQTYHIKNYQALTVQYLGLCTAWDMGSIPDQGTKIPHAPWCRGKNDQVRCEPGIHSMPQLLLTSDPWQEEALKCLLSAFLGHNNNDLVMIFLKAEGGVSFCLSTRPLWSKAGHILAITEPETTRPSPGPGTGGQEVDKDWEIWAQREQTGPLRVQEQPCGRSGPSAPMAWSQALDTGCGHSSHKVKGAWGVNSPHGTNPHNPLPPKAPRDREGLSLWGTQTA